MSAKRREREARKEATQRRREQADEATKRDTMIECASRHGALVTERIMQALGCTHDRLEFMASDGTTDMFTAFLDETERWKVSRVEDVTRVTAFK